MRRLLLPFVLVGCGASDKPLSTPCPNTSTAVMPDASAPVVAPGSPELRVVLHPRPSPSPKLAIEMRVSAPGDLKTFRLAVATSNVDHVTARDTKGSIEAKIEKTDPGITVTLARAPELPLDLSYELAANSNVRANTSDLVVADDRFRAFGENVVLLPIGIADTALDITVAIDGVALHAPDAASSFGVGTSRTRKARPRSLLRSFFVAGTMGRSGFDTGFEHDESAWLGYTAFDPRPVAAEIAQVRTSLRELWKGGGDDFFTLMFVSSARPSGAYTMLPRASSLVVHTGPGELWSAALRIGVAQHLMQAWIGGELRIGSNDLENLWLYEGVSRFFAAHVLEDLDLVSPEDARNFTVGLLSAQATSPHRGKTNVELAQMARSDPKARAQLAALGALHAIRVSSLLRAKKKNFVQIMLAMMEKARSVKGPLPDATWTDMLEKELGADEAKRFRDALSGKEVELPKDALGACFRADKAEYAAFDLGFDAIATAESDARKIVGLDPKGPAGAAGVKATDVLEDANFKEGWADVPAKLVLTRDGAKKEISYKPAGAKHAGIIFTRIPAIKDDACGVVL